MKIKDRLIAILQLFVCVAIPGTIYSGLKLSGRPLGGLETLILYAPFVFFYLHAEFKRKRLKLVQDPTGSSVPITPEMLDVSAPDDKPEVKEDMTQEERLKEIDACIHKAISDCAQGKISSKEFADICALLQQMKRESAVSAPGADEASPQPPAEETHLIETSDGLLIRVPVSKLDAWKKVDHDAPLTPAEEQLKEQILDSIYKKAASGAEQSEISPGPVKDSGQAYDKTISCTPNSSYVPIPWWRSTKVLARLALGLIAVGVVCAAVFAIFPSLDPTAAAPANATPSPSAIVTRPPAASVTLPPLPSEYLSEEYLSVQERLDRFKEEGQRPIEPFPRPRNGHMLYSALHCGEKIAPLTLDASSLVTDFCIKLRLPDTKAEVVSFYIHGGTKKTVYVPLGSFEILYASGTDWYGSQLLFGSETNYCLFDELFDFYVEEEYVNGWTITLAKQYSGNLDSTPISADEFFNG